MPRSRIEGLLASFPKLIGAADQHTFVETDAVRYVYQPLDDLYLVLVTNKGSNILQDISTLHLFARIVGEHCRSVNEREVSRMAFELLGLFDEIVSLGARENVSLAQIRTISEMESHEEKMQAEIEKAKLKEAKIEQDKKVKILDNQRREARKSAASAGFGSGSSRYGLGGGGGGGDFGSSYQSSNSSGGFGNNGYDHYSPSSASSNRYEPSKPAVQAPASGRKGMVLGKKTKDSELVEAIKTEEGVNEYHAPSQPDQTGPSSGYASADRRRSSASSSATQEGVHITVEEKISVTANRDGGLQNMEVKGDMVLKVTDPNSALIKVTMGMSGDSNIQYKTHPNVDKAAFKNSIIQLRDPSRPFPLNQALGLLKWRFVTKDEDLIPLSSGGACDVNIEYELQKSDMTLTDVCISIPYPAASNAVPTVGEVDGDYYVDRTRRYLSEHLFYALRCLDWQLFQIDSSNGSGVLEFSVAAGADDVSVFFPVKVSFRSKSTFCDVNVLDVVDASSGAGLGTSREVSSSTDSYVVV
ncbi:MAG: hypothetical protein SGCHY_001664 [Lobulomycetales sp.]